MWPRKVWSFSPVEASQIMMLASALPEMRWAWPLALWRTCRAVTKSVCPK